MIMIMVMVMILVIFIMIITIIIANSPIHLFLSAEDAVGGGKNSTNIPSRSRYRKRYLLTEQSRSQISIIVVCTNPLIISR